MGGLQIMLQNTHYLRTVGNVLYVESAECVVARCRFGPKAPVGWSHPVTTYRYLSLFGGLACPLVQEDTRECLNNSHRL